MPLKATTSSRALTNSTIVKLTPFFRCWKSRLHLERRDPRVSYWAGSLFDRPSVFGFAECADKAASLLMDLTKVPHTAFV
jgi:hypothetical protein